MRTKIVVCVGLLFASMACSSSSSTSSSSSSGGSSGGSSGSSGSSSGSSGTSSTSSSSGSSMKFSCSINGTCYKCADADSESKCFDTNGGSCTATDASYCM